MNKIRRKRERASRNEETRHDTHRPTDKEEHTQLDALKVNTTQVTLRRIFIHSDFMN